jgi:hypothetical protein
MAYDFAATSFWQGSSEASAPVTDLSPQVSGGPSHGVGYATHGDNDLDDTMVKSGAAIVIAALIILWLLGALALRSARL